MIALRVATTMMGTGGEADDVVQDAFVKAYTRLDQLDGRGTFRVWLLAIVANEARNRHRATGRRTALTLRVATPADARATDPAVDPVLAAEAGEARRRLAEAVADLPDREREIVALRYFAELTEAEAARVVGCPTGTVKSRLSRALVRLRSTLIEEVST